MPKTGLPGPPLHWYFVTTLYFVPSAKNECEGASFRFYAATEREAKEVAQDIFVTVCRNKKTGAWSLPNGTPIIPWKIVAHKIPRKYCGEYEDILPLPPKTGKKKGPQTGVVIELFPSKKKDDGKDPPKPPVTPAPKGGK